MSQFPSLTAGMYHFDKTTLKDIIPLTDKGSGAVVGWRTQQYGNVIWTMYNATSTDGVTFNRDDTGQRAFAVRRNADGSVQWLDAPAAANPITWTSRMLWDAANARWEMLTLRLFGALEFTAGGDVRIGTNDAFNLYFKRAGVDRAIIKGDGFAIGADMVPDSGGGAGALHVRTETAGARVIAGSYAATDANSWLFRGFKARGTHAARVAVGVGDHLVNFQGIGFGTVDVVGGQLLFRAMENWSGTQAGTEFLLDLIRTGTGTLNNRLHIASAVGTADSWIFKNADGTVLFALDHDAARLDLGANSLELASAGVFKMAGQNRFRHQNAICRAYANANTTIADNTVTEISLAAESIDTDTMHDNVTNNQRVLARLAGKYRVAAAAEWGALGASAGTRRVGVRRYNSSDVLQETIFVGSLPGTASEMQVSGSTILAASALDYFVLVVFQSAGGNETLRGDTNQRTFLDVSYIGE